MINIDISSQGVSYMGGTFSPTVIYENTTYGGVVPPVCPDWITFEYIGGAQEGNNYVESYRFSVEPNDGPVRFAQIVFECQDVSGETWGNHITVVQGTGEITEVPIWKDTFYYAPNVDVFKYSIKNADGVNIYYGKAYCAPGDGGPYVQVNKICQNYLKQNLGDFRELYNSIRENEGAYADFSICTNYRAPWQTEDEVVDGIALMNYRFLFDWTGDWAGEGAYAMTEPINGHIDPRMWLMYTEYNKVPREVTVNINDDGVPGGGDSGFTEMLVVSPTAVTVTATPGYVSINVTSNLDWEIVPYTQTFTINDKELDRFYIGYGVNTGDVRSGQFLVRNIGGTKSQIVEITQLDLGSTPVDYDGMILLSCGLYERYGVGHTAVTYEFDRECTEAYCPPYFFFLPNSVKTVSGGTTNFGKNYITYQTGLSYSADTALSTYNFTGLIFDEYPTRTPDIDRYNVPTGAIGNMYGYDAEYHIGSDYVILPDSIKRIGNNSLSNITFHYPGYYKMNGLLYGDYTVETIPKYVRIPQYLEEIGDSAFAYRRRENDKLYKQGYDVYSKTYPVDFSAGTGTDLTLPSTLLVLGSQAFAHRTNIHTVTIPSGVDMGDGAFFDCRDLESAVVQTTIPSMGTFMGCTALTSVTLTEGLVEIGDREFFGCINLSAITIPSTVKRIGVQAFAYMTNHISSDNPYSWRIPKGLTAVTLPQGLEEIGAFAFAGANLTELHIPSSVRKIECGAFNCNNLTDIYFHSMTPPVLSEDGYYDPLIFQEPIQVSQTVVATPEGPHIELPPYINNLDVYNYFYFGVEHREDALSCLPETYYYRPGSYKGRFCGDKNSPVLYDLSYYTLYAPGQTYSEITACEMQLHLGTVHYPAGADYSAYQDVWPFRFWNFVADL